MENQVINTTANVASENVPVVTLPVTLTADVLGAKLSGLEYGRNSNGVITTEDTVQSGINKILDKVHYNNLRILTFNVSFGFVLMGNNPTAGARAFIISMNENLPPCIILFRNPSITTIESLAAYDDEALITAIRRGEDGWIQYGEIPYQAI